MGTQLDLVKMAIAGLSKKERMALLAEFQPAPAPSASENRLVRRKEAARLLACSVRLIDKLSEEGLLTRVKLPGRAQSAGIRLADVERLIGGAS